ncbi:unnamed protein product [Angiostrongylus costaricensis]|uniref:Helicase ATP-binding domain-containing protein n=1 Tax=Angiostrongylus costaricensis TaxID=334426 RepID=A0A158PL45_ANGCS|nr:unnamed protein product [Angiostrongylus costaricensis]
MGRQSVRWSSVGPPSAGRSFGALRRRRHQIVRESCDARRKGLDRTLFGHVAVVFVDEVQPFLTGCVALDNQARFAEKSGALALVVGPASRIQRVRKPMKVRSSKIPVVVLDDQETQRLRQQLAEAGHGAAVARLRLDFVEPKPPNVLKLQVFRPNLLNLSLIGLLILLVIFITLLVFVKIRWRPTAHRDLWLRTLARAAVGKMEIRKFQKVRWCGFLHYRNTNTEAPKTSTTFLGVQNCAKASLSRQHKVMLNLGNGFIGELLAFQRRNIDIYIYTYIYIWARVTLWSDVLCNAHGIDPRAPSPLRLPSLRNRQIDTIPVWRIAALTRYIGGPPLVIVKARYVFNHLQAMLNEVECKAHPSRIDQRQKLYPYIYIYIYIYIYNMYIYIYIHMYIYL